MADLRRWITALAILALFTGLASAQVGGGGGQQLNCAVNTSATPTLRSEGITEQIGDIVITCTGGNQLATGAAIPLVNITVSLSTQVTSRLLATGGVSEALLMLDEPNSGLAPLVPGFGPAEPFTVCSTPATGCAANASVVSTSGGPVETAVNPTTGAPAANVYQGIVSGNQVTFYGVPILAPGTTASRIIRITNVRANANGIGGGSASGSIPVQASLLTSNFSALPISQATPIVGFVQQSLSTSNSTATAFAQCVGFSTSTVATATVLTYKELFGSAFKTRVDPAVPGQTSGQSNALVQNKPGVFYNSESGFTLPTPANGTTPAGLADFGTRLRALLGNVPAGARIFVSLYGVTTDPVTGRILTQVVPPGFTGSTLTPTSTTASAVLVTSDTVSDGAGPLPPAATATTPITVQVGPGTATATIAVVDVTNSPQAVWEVVTDNPNAIDTLQFGVFLTYVASPGTNSPAPGSGTVNQSYAPVSTVTTASSSAPIPRFIDTSTARTAISIAICRTVLLFPFLTNQAGFDTGIAIANTSTDPFGTTPQAATCDTYWYGSNSIPKYTTPTVATATDWVDLVSIRAPNFQGYMIAVCGFQYAHGFAFVSDLGARNLAMGYLPLIIPDPNLNAGRAASDQVFSVANSGEQLSQ